MSGALACCDSLGFQLERGGFVPLLPWQWQIGSLPVGNDVYLLLDLEGEQGYLPEVREAFAVGVLSVKLLRQSDATGPFT